MPSRIIYSNEPQNAKVQVYGSDLNLPLETSNGLLKVDLPGTPTVFVGNTVSITSAVEVAGTPQVSITGTPTVFVGNTVSITNAVEVAGTPTVILGGRAFTSILVTAFTLTPLLSVARNFTGPAIDVSQLSNYSYAVNIQTTELVAVQVVTPQVQAAPINDTNYFGTSDAGTAISLAIGSANYNQILNNNNFLQYSRFLLNVAAAAQVGGSIGVTVYLQGEY